MDKLKESTTISPPVSPTATEVGNEDVAMEPYDTMEIGEVILSGQSTNDNDDISLEDSDELESFSTDYHNEVCGACINTGKYINISLAGSDNNIVHWCWIISSTTTINRGLSRPQASCQLPTICGRSPANSGRAAAARLSAMCTPSLQNTLDYLRTTCTRSNGRTNLAH